MPVLPEGQLGSFVDNLGPGQVVGRQVLASPILGEIQIAITYARATLDVEIVRARGLVVKSGAKISPGKLNTASFYYPSTELRRGLI
jgi:regulating synaptic membrane exocytosis protein 2